MSGALVPRNLRGLWPLQLRGGEHLPVLWRHHHRTGHHHRGDHHGADGNHRGVRHHRGLWGHLHHGERSEPGNRVATFHGALLPGQCLGIQKDDLFWSRSTKHLSYRDNLDLSLLREWTLFQIWQHHQESLIGFSFGFSGVRFCGLRHLSLCFARDLRPVPGRMDQSHGWGTHRLDTFIGALLPSELCHWPNTWRVPKMKKGRTDEKVSKWYVFLSLFDYPCNCFCQWKWSPLRDCPKKNLEVPTISAVSPDQIENNQLPPRWIAAPAFAFHSPPVSTALARGHPHHPRVDPQPRRPPRKS